MINAVKSVNRKYKRNSDAAGGNISLDQTNEQGEALSEAVADERVYSNPYSIPLSQNTGEEYRDKMAVVADKLVDMGIEYRKKKIAPADKSDRRGW